MRMQYRLVLIYPDGSAHPGDVYLSREKLELKMHAIARKPGVRYCCEEWTVSTPTADSPDALTTKVAVYDV